MVFHLNGDFKVEMFEILKITGYLKQDWHFKNFLENRVLYFEVLIYWILGLIL